MNFNVIKSRSIFTFVTEHLYYQVFEFWRKLITFDTFKKLVKFTVENLTVEKVIGVGLVEWELTCYDEEENDAYGEDVDLPTNILFAL